MIFCRINDNSQTFNRYIQSLMWSLTAFNTTEDWRYMDFHIFESISVGTSWIVAVLLRLNCVKLVQLVPYISYLIYPYKKQSLKVCTRNKEINGWGHCFQIRNLAVYYPINLSLPAIIKMGVILLKRNTLKQIQHHWEESVSSKWKELYPVTIGS